MSKERKSPYLYVFEGVDGVGKSSVIKLVHDKIKKFCKVHIHREPTNEETLKKLANPNLSWLSRLYILMKDRDIHSRDALHRLLQYDHHSTWPIVLMDRSFVSSCVYQSYESGGKISPFEIMQAHHHAGLLFQAREILVLHAPLKEIQRRHYQREVVESKMLESSKDTFDDYVLKNKALWEKLDAMQQMYKDLVSDASFSFSAHTGSPIYEINASTPSPEILAGNIAERIMQDLMVEYDKDRMAQED